LPPLFFSFLAYAPDDRELSGIRRAAIIATDWLDDFRNSPSALTALEASFLNRDSTTRH
jgi:hypothetical protein